MIDLTTSEYGPDSTNALHLAADPGADGARAALRTFYYALNSRDLRALTDVWATDPLVQLNNPVGGILRGPDRIVSLYDRIFTGPVRLRVTFTDVVEYLGDRHVVFAGQEIGVYTVADSEVPLRIRTTRYFGYAEQGWRQLHHHGSIDDAAALAAYQAAVRPE